MKNLVIKIIKKLEKYFEKMAETNNTTYGNGRLDCCDLNREKRRK